MGTHIKIFADCRCTISESPMWNKKENMLYWRGFDGEMYRKPLNDNVNNFERFQLNIGKIGSMVFTDKDYILLFAEGAKIWKWKPYESPVLCKDYNKSLFNDVICDPKGRIYCGMLADNYFNPEKRGKYGSFWLLSNAGELTCIENSIGITPNGIRFSPGLDKLYFAVTDDDCIYEYDYDVESGIISNKKIFAGGCYPDGMAVDTEGNIWVANCKPGKPVMCYNHKGVLIDEIYFPVYRVISVAFGGTDGKTLFVTTGADGNKVGDYDGSVFSVATKAKGDKEYIFKGDVFK